MPTNVLSSYNPLIYANEALIYLKKNLGLAGAVHRGYTKTPGQKGKIIDIRVPSTFTAAAAPAAASNINASNVQITLDSWQEVKMSLTDQEYAYTQEQIFAEHLGPMMYALAEKIDRDLWTLYKKIPWYYDVGATAAVADIVASRKILFDNSVPLDPANMFFAIDSDFEADLLASSAFTQWQGAGQVGVESQLRGSLGFRFGFNFFASQNVPSHTKGTCNDTALQTVGSAAVGATTIDLDAVDAVVAGTLVAGDSFSIAGDTQRYVVTATNTASANVFTGVAIYPALKVATVDNTAVTVNLDNHVASMAFHRNAFALGFAPLGDGANALGAKVGTAFDPDSNIALRSRMYYDGEASATFLAFDVLYGFACLDPNLAVRARN